MPELPRMPAPATRAPLDKSVNSTRSQTSADPEASRARPMVVPLARALALLSVFTPHDLWLSNGELSTRSGLPPSTVSRMAQTLTALGYLHHADDRRKYRLAAPVLGLGYAAIAHSHVQRLARAKMQAFAEQHKVHLVLSTRDRLDMIVLEICRSALAPVSLDLHVGARISLATSPIGWALLAGLPEVERYYLLGNIQRRMPREWPRLRRRSSEAIAQVHEGGFCSSHGEWASELGMIAVPMLIDGNAPLVLACIGASSQMSRARVDRELGPRLVGIAGLLQQEGAVE